LFAGQPQAPAANFGAIKEYCNGRFQTSALRASSRVNVLQKGLFALLTYCLPPPIFIKGNTMPVKTLQDLFVHNLSDVYNAEKQLTKMVPKLIKAANHPELGELFQTQLEDAQSTIEQLDRVIESSGLKLKRIKCAAMEGLLEEAKEIMDEGEAGPVRDAALVGAAQKVVHYEIAAVGTLAAFATHLGFDEATQTLKEVLDAKKEGDQNFTRFAEENVNQEAEEKESQEETEE
jgi:ferritin-like metal-binding protein YciE